MTDYVITFRSLEGVLITGGHPADGALLAGFDPEAHQGRGVADWTEDVGQAMHFATLEAAWDCWQQVPLNRPTRSDGKPNRPLTAFTIEIGQL